MTKLKNQPTQQNISRTPEARKKLRQNIAIALLSVFLFIWTGYHILIKKVERDVLSWFLEKTDDDARNTLAKLNRRYDIPQKYEVWNTNFDVHNIIFKTHEHWNKAIINHDQVEIPHEDGINTGMQRMLLEPNYVEGLKVNLPIVMAFMKKHDIESEQDIIHFMSWLTDRYEQDAGTPKPPALVIYLIDTNQPYIGDCNDMAITSFCMSYILRTSWKKMRERSLLFIEIITTNNYNSNNASESTSGHVAILVWTWNEKQMFDPLAYENSKEAQEGGLMTYTQRHKKASGVWVDQEWNQTRKTYAPIWLLPLSHVISLD